MLSDYYGILVMFVFAASVALLFVFLAQKLGPCRPNPAKAMPYECGKEPFELPVGRHSVRFYLAGMLFVLFDVEIIFLFPWAVVYKDLALFGFLSMTIFVVLLELAFLYAWRKGALEWK